MAKKNPINEIPENKKIKLVEKDGRYRNEEADKPMVSICSRGVMKDKAIALFDVYYDWHLGYDEFGGRIVYPVRKF